jgi:hypothetical protein
VLGKATFVGLVNEICYYKNYYYFHYCKNCCSLGTILVVSITSVLLYLAHTSTPFHKKAKSSPKHTFYTPKTNHEKVTKMVIKFDNNEK